MRMPVLIALLAFALLPTTGCGPAVPKTLTVGVCDPLCAETASTCVKASATREYALLFLGADLAVQRKVTIRYFAFDQQLQGALAAGELDVAVGKVWPIMEGARMGGRTFERLLDIPRPDGVNALEGVFITRADSDLTDLASLHGKRIALGPEVAYEKSHAARKALEAAGAVPGDAIELDGCVPTAAAVIEQAVDAGVISNYVLDFGGLALVDKPEAFKVLGRTKPMPFITVAASTALDAALRAKLQSFLYAAGQGPRDVQLLSTGIINAEDWEPEKP